MAFGAAWISMWLLGASACPRTAALEGDPGLVERIRAVLAERGIEDRPDETCQGTRVHLAKADGDAMELSVFLGETVSTRSADTPEAAATLIESWVDTSLTDPLLEHALPEAPRAPLTPSASASDPPQTIVEQQPNPRSFALGAGGALGMADDSSSWSGFDLRGCVRVSPLCLGARLQYALDLGIGGAAVALGGERSILDLGATAELPLMFGQFELVPGLGVGHATVSSLRDSALGEAEEDSGGLRLRGQLGSSWRFSPRWALRMSAAVDYAPFAKAQISDTIEEVESDPIPLAGEPSVIGWLSLGLELGGI